MCVGCQEFFPKEALLKLTLTESAHGKNIQIDFKQKIPGRSFYLNPSKVCLESFLRNKKKALRKANLGPHNQLDKVLISLEETIERLDCPSLKENK